MKKTMFVAALAAVMIFALAAPAFANWGGWAPGNLYSTGVNGGAPRPSSSYVLWDDVVSLGTSGTAGTPHKGYTDSSTLCAVCHSVHFAPVWDGQFTSTTTGAQAPGTGDLTSGIQAQMLLRSKAGTACNFCHIDTAIGGVVVYAGDADIFGYSQNFTSSYAHDYHNAGCNDCHSVHGARTYEGSLESAILRQTPRGRQPQAEVVSGLNRPANSTTGPIQSLFASANDAWTSTGDRYLQQTAFCSSCHPVYTDNSMDAVGSTAAKHHPITGVITGRSSGYGTYKGANDDVRLLDWAFVGSPTCRSCHAAGEDGTYAGDKTVSLYSESSFPHYTKDKYRFLDQSSTAEYATDEVCLSCHVNSDDTAGVGISY
ncbi:MAG: hypothetical protein U1E29_13775 [Coriobacteriia bacterium]|nr:hypothetical protein [Coriobacteriia bacterium]